MNAVEVAILGIRPPRWHAGLPALCRRALDAAGIDGWDLSVLLTGDEGIRGLNARYRGKDRPTDVLSFPQGEGPRNHREARVAGDIVISVETLRRNAADRGLDERDELARLLVHGILHLDGMDHGEGRGRAMLDRQRRVLGKLHGVRDAAGRGGAS